MAESNKIKGYEGLYFVTITTIGWVGYVCNKNIKM